MVSPTISKTPEFCQKSANLKFEATGQVSKRVRMAGSPVKSWWKTTPKFLSNHWYRTAALTLSMQHLHNFNAFTSQTRSVIHILEVETIPFSMPQSPPSAHLLIHNTVNTFQLPIMFKSCSRRQLQTGHKNAHRTLLPISYQLACIFFSGIF
jgi:hypothetical protein